jgi:hypothetical protein
MQKRFDCAEQTTLNPVTDVEFNRGKTANHEQAVPFEVPTRECLQSACTNRILDLLLFYERQLQLVCGKILCGDKSCKIVKNVAISNSVSGESRGQESFKACDSFCTVMNEHNMIIACHFNMSGDYDEMENMLKRTNCRCEVQGFEEVELFQTDNCCQEHGMLTRAIPSLAKHDLTKATVPQLDLLQLPSAWTPKTIQTRCELAPFCRGLLSFIDQADGDASLRFDVEWDALTLEDKRTQKSLLSCNFLLPVAPTSVSSSSIWCLTTDLPKLDVVRWQRFSRTIKSSWLGLASKVMSLSCASTTLHLWLVRTQIRRHAIARRWPMTLAYFSSTSLESWGIWSRSSFINRWIRVLLFQSGVLGFCERI